MSWDGSEFFVGLRRPGRGRHNFEELASEDDLEELARLIEEMTGEGRR